MVEVGAFRYANWDTPFWVNPNRSEHRYNHSRSPATQYLSIHPLTPWAEYLRNENRTAIQDVLDIQGRVWSARITVPDDAIHLTFDNVSDFDLEPEDLISDDHGPCQALADRLRQSRRATTLIVPSAALPGTENVIILGPRVMVGYLTRELDHDVDIPAAVCGEASRPPIELLSKIRWRGQSHAAFEAWKEGRHFAYSEPELEVVTGA